MSNHADQSEVMANLRARPDGTFVAVIRLIAGETAWNPASTNGPLAGPARLDYFLHADGGVEVRVSELDRDL